MSEVMINVTLVTPIGIW